MMLTRNHKKIILMVLDTVLIIFSLYLSQSFLDVITHITRDYFRIAIVLLPLFYLIIAYILKVFSVINRFTDYKSLGSVGISVVSSYILFTGLAFFVFNVFSLRFIFLGALLSYALLITPRILWRFIYEWGYKDKSHKTTNKKKTLVLGAGSGGSIFIRTVQNSDTDIEIVGILDKDLNKKGSYLHGVKVLGNRFDIPRLVQELGVDQLTIAIPSITASEQETILDICQEINLPVNVMPLVEELVLGHVNTNQLKEIDIADLLGRKEVVLDQSQLSEFFSDKTVLVTGAGGSIGSEICRQISQFTPKRLLLLGHGENSIYLIHRELTNKYKDTFEIIPIIADIQDRDLIFSLMTDYRPDVVYHAAAHKHVPLMEYNPREAVKNNIFGTKNVAEAAKAAGVAKFVMVSTDKAVNPPNVMGATKRVAEMIVTGLNEAGQTQFVAVRFGNVLGSRGSVVPVFKDQIAQGGPLTVTDFRMTRYFMTIPEASRLVIQAGYLAKGGEVFVLDMGEPVKILDLAKKVIKLSGHTEKEIGIVETGIRPGEKLYEELLSSDERVSEQIHEKIFVGKVTPKPIEEVESFIDNLLQLDNVTLKERLIEFAKQE
ncbi:polysaccharide biosynthesis protein [Streptococcus hillyeri]|uniref:Polysaccharide biosynthesis protein n=1 Tax=Streptococcus hillyeri TaxID=2282420 RepID=A0A3L9DN80_9STRE|nr:nucleoside-diphosphate sugar epimerase/dehydratase [Streptococcus hillyeri]RLY02435.1 polysaccharide biosynthesis protein [Streptococcus hillyeri]